MASTTPDLAVDLSQHFDNVELDFVGVWYSMSSIPNDGFIFEDVITIRVHEKPLEFN